MAEITFVKFLHCKLIFSFFRTMHSLNKSHVPNLRSGELCSISLMANYINYVDFSSLGVLPTSPVFYLSIILFMLVFIRACWFFFLELWSNSILCCSNYSSFGDYKRFQLVSDILLTHLTLLFGYFGFEVWGVMAYFIAI